MQVETLKSALAQKELKLTKLKQSDSLKVKQINILEAKLQEALFTLTHKNGETKDKADSVKSNSNQNVCQDENIKIQSLENKTSNLELQLGLLSSKFESFMISFVTASKSNQSENVKRDIEKYICEMCEYESTNKQEVAHHKQINHQTKLSCKKCDYSTTKIDDLKNHKKDEHPAIIHSCVHCDFEATRNYNLKKNM